MFQQALQSNLQNIINFLGYVVAYMRRHNPFTTLANSALAMLKDFLTMNKKLKMAKYRVNYQMYKLNQMEQLIAENNEHVFLKGRKLNQTR